VNVETQVGSRGQFDVFVGEQVVATKQKVSLWARLLGNPGFPDEESAVAAVRAQLADA
jgi:hypothetical protein